MYTSVVKKERNDITELALYYEDCIINTLKNRLNMCYGNRSLTLGVTDCKRLMSEILSFKDFPRSDISYSFHSFLSSAFISAEQSSPYAGIICLYTLVRLILSNKVHDMDGFIHDTIKNSWVPSLEEWCDFYRQTLKHDKVSYDIFINALKHSDPAGQVSIKIDNDKETQVEIVDSHILPIGMHMGLSSSGDTIHQFTPKVCVIDGIIESVSEVHHIFEYFNRTGEPITIFARGFADDVISTIAKNRLRKTLDCIPVVIGVDATSMNYMVDVSVICNSDIVSSVKGELISSIDPESLPQVKSIEQTRYSTKISLESEHSGLVYHKIRVEEKRKLSHEALQENFHSRIKLLSGKNTHIILGRSCGDLCGVMKDRIDMSIQAHISILRFGMSEVCSSTYFKALAALGFKLVPTGAMFHGIKSAFDAYELLNGTSQFIIKDRHES